MQAEKGMAKTMGLKRFFFIGLFCLLGFTMMTIQTLACTIFYVKGSATDYFAGNEDWFFTDPVISVTPGNKQDYGYMVMGWNSYLPRYPQAGINENGLCFDWASLSSQQYPKNPRRKDTDEDLMVLILRKCRTVDEAVELIKKYNWPQFGQEHLLIADRTGNSCVVEWSRDDYVFIKNRQPYQVVTNFSLTDPKIGNYPCKRFDMIQSALKEAQRQTITQERVKTFLDQTHQEGRNPTVYSYIFDLKTLKVTIFPNHRYSEGKTYWLPREIKKGGHRIPINLN